MPSFNIVHLEGVQYIWADILCAAGGPRMFLKVSLFFDPKDSKHPDISFRVNYRVLRHLSKVKVKVAIHILFYSHGKQTKAEEKLLHVSKCAP